MFKKFSVAAKQDGIPEVSELPPFFTVFNERFKNLIIGDFETLG
jgi:hypothetical protein